MKLGSITALGAAVSFIAACAQDAGFNGDGGADADTSDGASSCSSCVSGSDDDVKGYPTAIITKIFQDIEAFSPKPPFVLATGDYQFASSGSSSTAAQQLGLYLGARKNYSGVQFPAMGNHECTGSTSSNC